MFGFFQPSADEYEPDSDRDDGLMFVREFPAFETTYRNERDPPTKETWSYKSGHAQLSALGDYLKAAGKVLELDQTRLMKRLVELLPHPGETKPNRYATKLGEPLEDFDKVRSRTRLVTSFGKLAFQHKNPPTLDDYAAIAPPPDPEVDVQRMLSDEVFGYLRVAGMNPVMLRDPVDASHVAACADLGRVQAQLAAHGDGLEPALKEGRLFVVDPEGFAILAEHLVPSHEPEHPHTRRYFCHPTAVFVRPRDSRDLMPVAIRCGAELSTLTPGDPQHLWARAKLHYAVADCTYHTFVSHLAHTHYPMEPVVIAARRVFGTDGRFGTLHDHPIGHLLAPHIEGTLAINRVARGTLFDGSTPFGDFVAADVESTTRLSAAATEERRRNFVTLPEAHPLPTCRELDYPFRDDFATMGEVLAAWVSAYVDCHYADDTEVRSDRTLGAFGEALRRGKGIGNVPATWDKRSLIRTLTTIVQIASIQHASIHFPQTDIGRLALVAPFYASEVPPGWNDDKDRITVLQTLPRLYAARWQAALFRLSNIRWRCLEGLHERFDRKHPRYGAHVESLGERIRAAGETIAQRNVRRGAAGLPRYRYMTPELAPCSINA